MPVTLTKPADGETIDAADVNTPLQTIADKFDAGILNADISTTAAIAFSKLAADAWSTWTPTWTNLTTGNGTLNVARYIKIGRIVTFYLKFTFGSTSSISGDTSFSLPASAASQEPTTGQTGIGMGTFRDDSANAEYLGTLKVNSTTDGIFRVFDATGTYLTGTTVLSATVPFTWTTSDVISARGVYEAAS